MDMKKFIFIKMDAKSDLHLGSTDDPNNEFNGNCSNGTYVIQKN